MLLFTYLKKNFNYSCLFDFKVFISYVYPKSYAFLLRTITRRAHSLREINFISLRSCDIPTSIMQSTVRAGQL